MSHFKQIVGRLIPERERWMGITGATIRADLFAGVTVAVVLVTQAVAFAIIAGFPPEYGLYAAMLAPIISAVFGSSRFLNTGPTTATSIVIFATVSQYADPQSAYYISLGITLTFLVGLIQLVLGLARMGRLVNFVSQSVIIGFTTGAAILIATKQLKYVFGLDIEMGLNFLNTWKEFYWQFGKTNEVSLLIALFTLVIAILSPFVYKKLPHMLLALLAGSFLCWYVDGVEKGVPLLGKVNAALPPFQMPNLNQEVIQELAPSAFALALLGLIGALSISRAIAAQSKQRIDGDREFIGQGLSNFVGSFFSCFAGSGSLTRSALNYQSGAVSPLSAIFCSIILVGIVFLLGTYISYIPMPVMAAVILIVAFNLIDFRQIREIIRTSKTELAVFMATFLATLFLDLEFAIYLGVILSLTFYLLQSSTPEMVILAPDQDVANPSFVNAARNKKEECPQLRVLRIDGSLYFGAVNHVSDEFDKIRKGEEKNLLLVAGGINTLDMAGSELLASEAELRKSMGGRLFICGLKSATTRHLKRGGFYDQIGAENFFDSKNEAIAEFYKYRDLAACQTCMAKVFVECKEDTAVMY